MNDIQLGSVFRAVRVHRRMRQEDFARVAGTSASSVSRIERGQFTTLPLDVVRRVAAGLEIRLDLVPSWRGGDLERVTNARHSSLHADRRMLAVFELKADLGDPAGLVAQVDRYRRLAPEIARNRGWDAESVSCWAVVADTDTNRRRLAAHHELLRGAFPADGRELARWLRDPDGRVDGLTFLAYPHPRTGKRSLTALKRVRLARTT